MYLSGFRTNVGENPVIPINAPATNDVRVRDRSHTKLLTYLSVPHYVPCEVGGRSVWPFIITAGLKVADGVENDHATLRDGSSRGVRQIVDLEGVGAIQVRGAHESPFLFARQLWQIYKRVTLGFIASLLVLLRDVSTREEAASEGI